MKTSKTRFLLFIVHCSLFILFCTPGFAASGGYVEKELPSPAGYEALTAPVALPDGGFAQAGKRAGTDAWDLLAYASLSGDPQAMPLEAASGEISSISIAPDGQIMALISNLFMMRRVPGEASDSGPATIAMNPEDRQTTVVWYDANGAITATLTVPGMAMSSVALSGRRTAVTTGMGMMGGGVTIYDDQGGAVASINRNDVFSLVAGPNDGLYIVQQDRITLVDTDGQTRSSYPSIQNLRGSMTSAPDGALYMVGVTGVYRLEADAAEPTLIADAARYLIGAPDSNISGICALDDGTLIVQLGGGMGFAVQPIGGRGGSFRLGGPDDESTLMAYVFNPDLDMRTDTVFTVTALRESTKIRKAVSDFQREHPELTVNYQTLLAADDTDTPVEDAIRTLNTDLFAGKGGDILILDEMPLAHYIDRGVLLPLDDLLAGMDFLPGILEGSRASDGKLYALPAQFQFGTLWGNRDILSGVDTLGGLVNLPLDDSQELMYPRTPEDLLKLFYPASRAALLDDTGKPRFDTPEFEAFLEELYLIYSVQSFSPGEVAAGPGGRRMGNMGEMQGMLNGSLAAMHATLSSTMTSAMPYTVAGTTESLCIPVPGLSGAGRAYTPVLLPGINARTERRALCEEFIRLLYSPEIQELESMEGLPTVAASLDKLIDDAKEVARGGQMRMAMSFGGNSLTMEQLDDAAWDALRALCDTLNQASIDDPTLMGFIVEETANFFEGYVSAQDAARAVQQRAAAYLNE